MFQHAYTSDQDIQLNMIVLIARRWEILAVGIKFWFLDGCAFV